MSKQNKNNKPKINEQKITKQIKQSNLKNYQIKKGDFGYWVTKNLKLNLKNNPNFNKTKNPLKNQKQ